jgi:hypothetical protein
MSLENITWDQVQAMVEHGLDPETALADLKRNCVEIPYGDFETAVAAHRRNCVEIGDFETAVADLRRNFVEIVYGDFGLKVPPEVIENCHKLWVESPSSIRSVLIEAALKKAAVKIEKAQKTGTWPSKTVMDKFANDMILWHTRIVAG